MQIESDGRFDATPLVCHACRATDQAARVFTKQEHADTDGLYYVLRDRGVSHA